MDLLLAVGMEDHHQALDTEDHHHLLMLVLRLLRQGHWRQSEGHGW